MPRVQREANVTWEGNVARGSGAISAATGAFDSLPYSLATRVERPDGKTSPEELLAAAHAACYAMSLAGELAGADSPPERLDVHATITLDQVEDGSHRIVASELLARARVKETGPGDACAPRSDRERGLPVHEADRGKRKRDGDRDPGGGDEWRLIARPK